MCANIGSLQYVSLSNNLATRKKWTVVKKLLPGRTVRVDSDSKQLLEDLVKTEFEKPSVKTLKSNLQFVSGGSRSHGTVDERG